MSARRTGMRTDARLVAASLGLAIASYLMGCAGGAQQVPARAPSPASTAEGSPQEPAPAADAAPASAPAAGAIAPPAPPAQTSVPSEEKAPSMDDEVRADMRRAEHDIASGNCPIACRALGSMERAVVFLCTGNNLSKDDADRCDNARHHLRSARHRIRTTCGDCPGGPSVDADAPVPSTTTK